MASHARAKVIEPRQWTSSIESRPVSIVVPVYNGATTVPLLVSELVEANPGHPLQIVLVNDASVDGSAGACRDLASAYPGVVTFVDLARNVGEHNAVMAGLAHARGDYCVIVDDDLQNPPEEVFALVRVAAAEDRDIVFSVYRDKRHHWARNLGSRFVNRLARLFMKLPEGLYLSSFKCLSRFAVNGILAYKGPFPYIDGLALRVTRNIGVLPTEHRDSLKGKSTYTVSKLLALFFNMAVNFSILPLRVTSAVGVILSAGGLFGACLAIIERLRNPSLPVGWTSLAVFILFLSGIQLLMLGILGEYMGQLLMTVNGTPQYVVRSVVEVEVEPDEG